MRFRADELMTIAQNLRHPSVGREALRRVRSRGSKKSQALTRATSKAWASDHAESLEDFAGSLDSDLWQETTEFSEALAGSSVVQRADGLRSFGGADYRLLFFLVRHLKPSEVVETGVAAGYSSAAILEAMDRNGKGHLYSSDLPYISMQHPEEFIGSVVAANLRERWDLRVRGDRVHLPELAQTLNHVDLFHYDSDKSFEGRTFALDALEPVLDSHSVVVFDDIQDNAHFQEWTKARSVPFRVFGFSGKYVGLVGL